MKDDERTKLKLYIVDAIRRLGKNKPACDLAGIQHRTFLNWKAGDKTFAMQVRQARAAFIDGLMDQAKAKEPFKMIQAVYPEYRTDPDTVVNIDNRPLLNVPTTRLLQILKENPRTESRKELLQLESNKESHGEIDTTEE